MLAPVVVTQVVIRPRSRGDGEGVRVDDRAPRPFRRDIDAAIVLGDDPLEPEVEGIRSDTPPKPEAPAEPSRAGDNWGGRSHWM